MMKKCYPGPANCSLLQLNMRETTEPLGRDISLHRAKFQEPAQQSPWGWWTLPPVRKSREDLHLDIPQSSLEGLLRTFLQESGTSESFGFYWVLSLAASFDLRYCEHFNRLYYIFSLFVGNPGTNSKLSAIMALVITVCTHTLWLYPWLPLIFPQIFLQLLFTPLHSVLLQVASNPFRNESANAEIQWTLKKIHSHPTLWEDNAASQTQFWRLLWRVTTPVTLGKLLDNSKLPFPPF